MKLCDLLAGVPEAGLTVLNSKADLDRAVDGLDTSETPDIAKYIKPNTLLLTTAMLYHDDQKSLARLVKELNQAGVSGLGIKLGRFIRVISPEVLKTADRLRFPLLRVPMNTTLGIASHLLQSKLLGHEASQFNTALEIHKKVSQALFRDYTLEELISYFARLLDRHVLYYDYFFDLAAKGSAQGHTLSLSDKVTGEIGGLLLDAYKLKPFSGIEELILKGSFGEVNCMVAPVEAGNQYPFFLAILHEGDLVEPFSSLVTEQAGIIFSFSTHNQRMMLGNSWRAQEELFNRLMSDGGPNESADLHQLAPWMDAAAAFSFLNGNAYQVVAAGYKTEALSGRLSELDHFELTYRWLKKNLALAEKNSLLLPLISKQRFLLLWRESMDHLPAQLEKMAEALCKIVPLDLRFGIGNQAHSLKSLRYSSLEAYRALDKALNDDRGEATQRVHLYYSEGTKELFQFVPLDHIRHFCLHVLGNLAFPEGEYELELRRTMEAYLNCQADITETSKKVHAHRNTVKYRLSKVEHLLGRSLSDPDFSLMARLALLLSEQSVSSR